VRVNPLKVRAFLDGNGAIRAREPIYGSTESIRTHINCTEDEIKSGRNAIEEARI
jgi:hypothetical protein